MVVVVVAEADLVIEEAVAAVEEVALAIEADLVGEVVVDLLVEAAEVDEVSLAEDLTSNFSSKLAGNLVPMATSGSLEDCRAT